MNQRTLARSFIHSGSVAAEWASRFGLLTRPSAALRRWARFSGRRWGPRGWGRAIPQQKSPAHSAATEPREVQALLRLAERYGSDRLEQACRRALDAGDGRYRTVRGLLERDLEAVGGATGAAEAAPEATTGAAPAATEPSVLKQVGV